MQKSTVDLALKQQLGDPVFIDRLLELSGDYSSAALYPTQTQDPEVKLFLDTLFRAGNEQQIRKGAREMATFLDGFNLPQDRLTLLRMSKDLLDKEYFPLFSSDKVPQQLEALLLLGRAYVALKPIDLPPNSEPLNFFLDTLYRAEGNQYIGKARIELQQFVQNFDSTEDKIRLLKFSKNLLEAAKLVQKTTQNSALKAQWRDPAFIAQMLSLVKEHSALVNEIGSDTPATTLFLDTIYRADTPDERSIRAAAQQMNTFFQGFDTADKLQRLVEFEGRLLDAAGESTLVQNGTLAAEGLNQLILLGRKYASLDPSDPSSTEFFLNTLWKNQNTEKGARELEKLLNGINDPVATLRFVQRSLDAAQQVENVHSELKKVNFISGFISFAVAYSDAPFGDGGESNTDGFWSSVWGSGENGDLSKATDTLQSFIESDNLDDSIGIDKWLLGSSSDAEILYANTSGQQDPCMDLLGQIRALIAQLTERAGELINDPWELQFDHWKKENPKFVRFPDGKLQKIGSVEGHQIKFREIQKKLRDLLKKWDEDDCRSQTGIKITKSERNWAFKDTPNPIPKTRQSQSQGFQLPDWAVALGVVVAGGAIVIGAALTLPAWAVAALVFLAATASLQLIDQRPENF